AGIRYIKNDCNAALRWSGEADLIYENQRAVIAFYKSLTEKFPDLYIENCGSGGMRADYGMLKNFCLQSVSDQEIYYLNPPVLQGMLANVIPEQAGSWAYPYPNLFDTRGDLAEMRKTADLQADGRQTVFNMVNGLAGNVYLSGRIDYSDAYNDKLISEGLSFFKRIREFKNNASAVYPTGFADICDLGEFATLGLIGYGKDKMYLFFWKFKSAEKTFEVPLKKWAKGGVTVNVAYPSDSGITACVDGNVLRVNAGEDYSAAIFEIIFKGETV
ncbi:MAG: alpha-galactosidase, partial [Clostridia bacterium]|nr:alpha-galactosidase [Clostridia bacterium]